MLTVLVDEDTKTLLSIEVNYFRKFSPENSGLVFGTNDCSLLRQWTRSAGLVESLPLDLQSSTQ